MSVREHHETAAALRQAFDSSFAVPAGRQDVPTQDVLALRVDGLDVAVRVTQCAGVVRCPVLASAPSGNRALSGLTGVRGVLVAVYDVARLLGRTRPLVREGWIVSCRADASAALLFDEVQGHVRAPEADLRNAVDGLAGLGRDIVSIGGRSFVLLSIPAALEAVERAAHPTREE
jgi:purine-binding chemotaxis protein CheW